MNFNRYIITAILFVFGSSYVVGQAKPKGHRTFGIECSTCHVTNSWTELQKNISFDHRVTGYFLEGEHKNATCNGCHNTISLDDLHLRKTVCITCHKDPHKGEFGNECQNCHSPSGWRAPSQEIQRHALTRFPLIGPHATVDCKLCHANQEAKEYVNTPTECFSCHAQQFTSANKPDHVSNHFDHDCLKCHTLASGGWTGNFVHPYVEFMFSSAHKNLECAQCHTNGYANTPTQCYGCHQKDYAGVASPNHVTGNFNHDCTRCHNADKWKPSTFDHASTKFPLTGKHITVACQQCHATQFAGTSSECWNCHQNDYAQAKFPDHTAAQFNHDCTTCHSMNGWKPAQFSHDQTKFPLTGKHITTECQLCHVNGKYANMPLECQGCHDQNYRNTTQPNHQLVGFTLQCQDCHSTQAWVPVLNMPSNIDHDKTKFQLVGNHKNVLCEKCHVNFVFRGTPTDCFACHQKDFNATKNPNHVQSNFPHECLTCHSMNGWKPAQLDHDKTQFPLVGKHKTVDCAKCHINDIFKGTATHCFACHQIDYNATKNPDHVANTLDHDCTKCHNLNGWKPAQFDHSTTRFLLTGGHANTQCSQCHINGQYANTPIDCFSCHQKDFTNVTTPNHVTGQFNHDCTTCHNTTAWKPSTFDHATTQFPLTGKHISTDCQQCHTNGNYNIKYTECYQCHQTDFTTSKQPDHVAGKFLHDCTKCHTTAAWKPAQFDHSTTKFALTGAHITTACEQCHVNGNYNITYNDCYTCHQSDFATSKQPDHIAGQFNHDCTKCHSTATWKPAQFDHATTKFPLTGAHITTACEKCHANGNYNITYTDCYQCHQSNYISVTNPNHVTGKLDHNCTKCHNTIAWKPGFDHATTKFQLTGAHISTPCEQCHVNGNYTSLAYNDCFQCHQDKYAKTTQPNHVTGKFDHDCTKCHTTDAWKPATFDHATTKFALTGAHITTPCEQCHVNGNYNITYSDCYTCHQSNFASSKQPDHVAGQFNHDCTNCHTTSAWKPAQFDHATTKFPLTGAHLTTACEKCHINGNYTITFNDCYTCHQADFASSKQPDHVSGQFNHDCTQCHTTAAWKPAQFNHATTKFPLTGAHITTACEKCHVNGNYNVTYTDCYSCHQDKFNAVTNPNHVAGKFDHDCTKCHSTTAWKPATFDHATTNFPLTGAHITTACEKCHVNGNYNLIYTDCYQCHQNDFAQVTTPNHAAGKFPNDCTKCHTTTAWKPSTFNHAQTNFPLVGAHLTVQCQNCHTNGNYNLTYADCFQCHQTDFNGAQNPNHVSNNFPHDCTSCHNMIAWKPSTFNHNNTNFPLVGAHTNVQCTQCHVNGNYQLTFTECLQCHQSDFNGAQNPPHASNQLPHDCTKCHTQSAWQPSTFNHSNTGFPLVGAHVSKSCIGCHVNGNYNITYINCWQCHQNDFNGVQNPNHVSNQYSHDCLQCHTQNAWQPSTFNHNNTNFPLVGAHASQACVNCHVNGNYQLTYIDCYQCHQSNYTGAQNPPHASNQFPHDCTKCHTQSAWQPSTFNHNNTAFPLIGAHASQACINCHVNGNYNIAYSNCYQCHQSDFNGASSPNHVTNQFSHDCTLCHNQNAWQPSTFNHNNTNFPLIGAHASQPCINCHVNGNYTLTYTNCYQCHQSDYNGATNPNHASNQFSHTCTLCHSQTAWQPSTFNHNNTNFPLVGAHTSLQCSQCHTNGNYQLVYTNCYQCHQSNYTGATTPANHVAMNLDHNCTTCHTQTAWNPATPFRTSHNVNYPTAFPIYSGAKHNWKWNTCNQCHTTNNINAFCCTSACHTNQSGLASDHSGVSGYTYTCTSCATCHPDGRAP